MSDQLGRPVDDVLCALQGVDRVEAEDHYGGGHHRGADRPHAGDGEVLLARRDPRGEDTRVEVSHILPAVKLERNRQTV